MDIEMLVVGHSTNPAVPSTFECDLEARWRLGNDNGSDWVRYLGVDTQGNPHTWLEWSKPHPLDATDAIADTGNKHWDMKSQSTCSSNEPTTPSPTCKYVIPAGYTPPPPYPSDIRIFGNGWRDAADPPQLYEGKRNAHPLAGSVTVIGVIGLTSCPNSASCNDAVNDYGDGFDNAVVDTRVNIYQLDVNGTTDASGGLCVNHATPALRRNTITRLTHHFVSTHQTTLTLSTAPGCSRRILAFLYVRAYSQAPVKIDPGNITHMFMLNNE
jgi:hypothetical protein